MRVLNYTLVTNGDMSGTITTAPSVPLTNMQGYSVQATYTGSPSGTINLQASVNGVTFTDMGDTVQSISGPGSSMWNVPNAYWQYTRLVFVPTGGSSGSLSSVLFARGES